MPAHLDAPVPGTPVDPLCFQLRGWLWLDTVHTQTAIASVEAHTTAPDGTDVLLGFTSTLYARPDVSAALSLPPTALTGFEFFCHHPFPSVSPSPPPSLSPSPPPTLTLHARLR
ncbi:MAG: hypothetical protein NTX09_04165, partial [Verrucomicrobia bacterium]|nr:hypothetical protein [Verrucomicrobiota bacterium]